MKCEYCGKDIFFKFEFGVLKAMEYIDNGERHDVHHCKFKPSKKVCVGYHDVSSDIWEVLTLKEQRR
jgi:hypothetical protein